jgi:DNA-binding IclR family transcriptional regulator
LHDGIYSCMELVERPRIMERRSRRLRDTPRVDGARSIKRAISVLQAVGAGPIGGCTLSAVVEATGLSKTTVHRLLAALVNDGFVRRVNEVYSLGKEIYVLGMLAAAGNGLHQLALPAVHRLAVFSQDTAFLCMVTGDDAVCVHREEGNYPIRTHVLQPGDRYPLGCGSFGMAILATLEAEEADRILDKNAARIKDTYFPKFSLEKTRQLIRSSRQRGYSVNPGLNYPESWGISVAIMDESLRPIGALVIDAIKSRLQSDRQVELADALKAECKTLHKAIKQMQLKPAG